MAPSTLLHPTVYVEVCLRIRQVDPDIARAVCNSVNQYLSESIASFYVGQKIFDYEDIAHATLIENIEVADYAGPPGKYHAFQDVVVDVQAYSLKPNTDGDPRRRIQQPGSEDHASQARILHLPNVALKEDWGSLIYDDDLPSLLLSCLARMIDIMQQPNLNLSLFNWNRLCLLHGPPGSGKSTLCRALAQKLSIRLSQSFPSTMMVEVSMSAMLSKYFGESGKLISSLFERICAMAQSSTTLVCVVMDEVETIATSREKSANGGECSDGFRATNQLLAALDRIRAMPNIIVLCTSNFVDAIDPAFLDRVDIKKLVPSPSPAAIYNIFRSCLNELIRSGRIADWNGPIVPTQSGFSAEDMAIASSSDGSNDPSPRSPRATKRSRRRSASSSPLSSPPPMSSPPPPPPRTHLPPASPVPETATFALPVADSTVIPPVAAIPTFAAMTIRHHSESTSPARRVWALAQRCGGLSGRTLRRLPILALAMHTWGGAVTMDDALMALGKEVEAAVGHGEERAS